VWAITAAPLLLPGANDDEEIDAGMMLVSMVTVEPDEHDTVGATATPTWHDVPAGGVAGHQLAGQVLTHPSRDQSRIPARAVVTTARQIFASAVSGARAIVSSDRSSTLPSSWRVRACDRKLISIAIVRQAAQQSEACG
jgi:hypothetical protein